MKDNMSEVKNDKIALLLENIYLLLGALFIMVWFFDGTTFHIEWPAYTYVTLRDMMLIVTLMRLGYSEKFSKKELIVFSIIAVMLLASWRRCGNDGLFNTLVYILGAKGISFHKFLKFFLGTQIALILCITVAALSGQIDNLIYQQGSRRARMALGSIYPTDYSAHIFYIVLTYVCVRNEKIKYIEIGSIALLGVIVYIVCGARLNSGCIILVAAVLLYHKTRCLIKERKNQQYEMNSVWSIILASAAPLFALFMTISSIFYSPNNKILYLLNKILSYRISMGNRAINIYGFSPWGTFIKEQGYGGTTKEPEFYFFLDSSYISVLLKCGIVALVTILIIFILISFKARKEKNWIFLWVLSLTALQCMIEHHMLEIVFVPFFCALFADTHLQKSQENGSIKYL